jgi:hypothetical protein
MSHSWKLAGCPDLRLDRDECGAGIPTLRN